MIFENLVDQYTTGQEMSPVIRGTYSAKKISMTEKNADNLSLEEIEEIEKLTIRWIFQAILDFGMEAHEIFLKSPDCVKDIAEDITQSCLIDFLDSIYNRESMERLIIKKPDM
jgi:hypothetical protein